MRRYVLLEIDEGELSKLEAEDAAHKEIHGVKPEIKRRGVLEMVCRCLKIVDRVEDRP